MINLNDRRNRKEQLNNEQIEATKDEVVAASRRFAMKCESGVAKEDDFLQCLQEIGMARKKREEI